MLPAYRTHLPPFFLFRLPAKTHSRKGFLVHDEGEKNRSKKIIFRFFLFYFEMSFIFRKIAVRILTLATIENAKRRSKSVQKKF
jgi:hypothetical protein